eukprot:TRINITY_DN7999_c0_g1_i1.p2 TRINITY_DN7999_c0_g1~~TRINITY_DN7999_c0_g1_i1.p2  ORF type:complete len:138 (+),score=8.40 TRINITY_DN7999_c0_g1_i1:467-880(+)
MCGNPSFNSDICCSPSLRPVSMEAILDLSLVSHDIHYARDPQDDGGDGPTPARQVVCRSMFKEKTPPSRRLVYHFFDNFESYRRLFASVCEMFGALRSFCREPLLENRLIGVLNRLPKLHILDMCIHYLPIMDGWMC